MSVMVTGATEVPSKSVVNGQAVYPLSEQDGLKARERR